MWLVMMPQKTKELRFREMQVRGLRKIPLSLKILSPTKI